MHFLQWFFYIFFLIHKTNRRLIVLVVLSFFICWMFVLSVSGYVSHSVVFHWKIPEPHCSKGEKIGTFWGRRDWQHSKTNIDFFFLRQVCGKKKGVLLVIGLTAALYLFYFTPAASPKWTRVVLNSFHYQLYFLSPLLFRPHTVCFYSSPSRSSPVSLSALEYLQATRPQAALLSSTVQWLFKLLLHRL